MIEVVLLGISETKYASFIKRFFICRYFGKRLISRLKIIILLLPAVMTGAMKNFVNTARHMRQSAHIVHRTKHFFHQKKMQNSLRLI